MRTLDRKRAKVSQHQLRTRLFETGLLVQELGHETDAKETIDEINTVIGLTALNTLADGKNVFPAIVAIAPHMVSLLEQEQEKSQMLSEKLCTAIEHFEEGFSEDEKRIDFKLIRFTFNDWMAQVLSYLNKLELVVQELIEEDVEPGYGIQVTGYSLSQQKTYL